MRVAPRVLAIALLAASPAGSAAADWTFADDGGTQVASVRSDAGDALRVFVDPEAIVRVEFTAGTPLGALHPGSCPSYAVDDGPPQAARLGTERCRVEGRSAIFALGVVSGDAIASDALLDLMNGSELTVRYRLDGLGYHEARLSLRGSKQAVNAAIGQGVTVVPELP